MGEVATVGIDLAKDVFAIGVLDASGAVPTVDLGCTARPSRLGIARKSHSSCAVASGPYAYPALVRR